MDLILFRYNLDPTKGIFGFLTSPEGISVCETLEHNFDGKAIIPPGVYTCRRGLRSLDGERFFQTFEVTGVTGHTGLLFHCGNWNKDSRGCILTGDYFDDTTFDGDPDMIIGSRSAFARFMDVQKGVDEFQLTVQ